MSGGEIREARTDDEIKTCWEIFKEFRPHLIDSQFVPLVQQLIKEERYHLMYICDTDGTPGGILGFRTLNFIYSGKTLYIDDLCTLSTKRRKGFGEKLLDWVISYAKNEGFKTVSLDSGYRNERRDAHRLFLNKKLYLSCHHFRLDL